MLTREQFQQLRDKGLDVNQIVSFEKGETPETKKMIVGSQFAEKQPQGFLEKTRGFVTGIIGGEKLAEGAGKALAAPGVTSGLLKEQDETFALQQKLLQTIRDKRTRGEDTSRLENALKQSQNLALVLSDAHKDFEESLPTTKEVIGSAGRLATTLGAGLVARTAGKALALGKAVGVGQGALRGVGAGAITGGIIGGLEGVGVATEADKTSEEILSSGLLGAGFGAVTGGAVGALTGGIVGGLKQRTITKENFAKELVSPKETTKIKIQGIKQGRLKDPTLFKKAELEFTKRDEKMAAAVKDIVSPKATIGENIDAITNKISQTDKGVKDFIQKNKVPFNTNQLKSKLETGKNDLELIFASDTTAERTYNAVSDAFLRTMDKKDTLGLFKARQEFDQIPAIKKLLESDRLGENARKEIVFAVRRAANEYISSLLPKGNPYKEAMALQTQMLEALGNLAEKSQNIIGKNKIQLLTEEYPILKWVVGGLATGIAGAAGIGVGGAIIGSTE